MQLVHFLTDNESIGQAICQRAEALNVGWVLKVCECAWPMGYMWGWGWYAHLSAAYPVWLAPWVGAAATCSVSCELQLCESQERTAPLLQAAAVVMNKHQRGRISEFFL